MVIMCVDCGDDEGQIFQVDETNAQDREFWHEMNPGVSAMSHSSPEGKAVAYVCQNFTCQAPTSDPTALEQLLAQTPPAPKISNFKIGSMTK
jgi:uncharacterized protein YyaL (SSP411 family)